MTNNLSNLGVKLRVAFLKDAENNNRYYAGFIFLYIFPKKFYCHPSI